MNSKIAPEVICKIDGTITDMISEVLLNRFRIHSICEDFKISRIKLKDDGTKVFRNKMAMILISGRNLRFTIKIHFDHSDMLKVVARVYDQDLDKIGERKTIDFMKEYCNLVGGYLKKLLMEKNIPVGISLPFYTRGFYEVFYEMPDSELSYTQHFEMFFDETSIIASVTQEYFDIAEVHSLSTVTLGTDSDSEEIDFL